MKTITLEKFLPEKIQMKDKSYTCNQDCVNIGKNVMRDQSAKVELYLDANKIAELFYQAHKEFYEKDHHYPTGEQFGEYLSNHPEIIKAK